VTATAVDIRERAQAAAEPQVAQRRRRRLRPGRVLLHTFLVTTALSWLAPLLWAGYTALRPYQDTFMRGYFSLPHGLNLDNFTRAWQVAELPRYYVNTFIVTVPAIVLTLLFASFVAYGVSRHSWRLNLALLMIFTAGNLLPQQVIIIPLYRLFKAIPLPLWISGSGSLYDTYIGLIAIHVAFQAGFCTFVLSNYMKTIPHELSEAAMVDGASVWRQFWQVIMPLCRPALAALATLQFTWVYNDFFWAVVLANGPRRPITSALNNLKGTFFVDYNLIAAGSLLIALPTLIVYVLLQKQFVSGLTLGSTKG
jgi:multiple sugar transport system permease protein